MDTVINIIEEFCFSKDINIYDLYVVYSKNTKQFLTINNPSKTIAIFLTYDNAYKSLYYKVYNYLQKINKDNEYIKTNRNYLVKYIQEFNDYIGIDIKRFDNKVLEIINEFVICKIDDLKNIKGL